MITVVALLLGAVFAIFNADTVAGLLLPQQPAAEPTSQARTLAPEPARIVVDTETEALLMELRTQYLDDRAETINWWLIAVTIALAFITLLVVIAGLLGYRVFRDILDDARGYRDEARQSATEATANLRSTEKASERIQEIETEAQERTDAITNFQEITGQQSTKAYGFPATADPAINATSGNEVDRAIAAAEGLQQSGDDLSAAKIWHGVASTLEHIEPDRAAQAWFWSGYLFSEAGKYENAITSYNEAIQLNPDYADAYNNRGHAKWMLGNHEGAVADCDVSIQLEPENANAYTNRGNARYQLGLRAYAVQDYDQAIQFKPDYAPAYNNLGSVRYDLGDYTGALTYYTQAIELNSKYVDAYYNRANARFQMSDYEGAVTDYNVAILLNPQHAKARYNRGWVMLALRRRTEALADFEKALELAAQQGDDELKRTAEQATVRMNATE